VAVGVESAVDLVGLDDSAVSVDGLADYGHRLCGVVADLGGVEAEDLPEVGLEEVVALIVGADGLAAGVPGVAVAFDVEVPVLAEEGEVEEIAPLVGHGLDVVFALGQQAGIAESAVEVVLDGAAGEEVVDVLSEVNLIPIGGNEENPPPPLGRNRAWKLLEVSQIELQVLVVGARVVGFIRNELDSGDGFESSDGREVPNAAAVGFERIRLVEGDMLELLETA